MGRRISYHKAIVNLCEYTCLFYLLFIFLTINNFMGDLVLVEFMVNMEEHVFINVIRK